MVACLTHRLRFGASHAVWIVAVDCRLADADETAVVESDWQAEVEADVAQAVFALAAVSDAAGAGGTACRLLLGRHAGQTGHRFVAGHAVGGTGDAHTLLVVVSLFVLVDVD